jgi:hypothetical protein
MKRRKARMERRNGGGAGQGPFATRTPFPALHRNPLAAPVAAAYSSLHRRQTTQTHQRKDSTMKATSLQIKVAGFVFAVLASASVLGGTVGAMEASAQNVSGQVVTLERLVVSAETSNAVN